MSSNETKKAMMSVLIAMPIMPVTIEQQQAVELAARGLPPGQVRVGEHDGQDADGGEQHDRVERVPVVPDHAGEADHGLAAAERQAAGEDAPDGEAARSTGPTGRWRRPRRQSSPADGDPGERALAPQEQVGEEDDDRGHRDDDAGQDHGDGVVQRHLEQPPDDVDELRQRRCPRSRPAATA